ncbi:MAG TPA: hypothetical protein VFX68_09015, partial [Sulfuricurvum sp.]|nr:hypothetical protein [Sulfuricurvum sp.]
VELGYLGIAHDNNYLNSGFLIGYRPMDRVEILAEVYRSATAKGNDESITLNGGVTYTFNPNVSGLFSMGQEVVTSSNLKPVLFFVGLQLLFK